MDAKTKNGLNPYNCFCKWFRFHNITSIYLLDQDGYDYKIFFQIVLFVNNGVGCFPNCSDGNERKIDYKCDIKSCENRILC